VGRKSSATREHVLADLSINYVERQILLRGFAVNRMVSDYGIDLVMLTFTEDGEVENGHVLFQVKATDSLKVLRDGRMISLRIESADLRWWREEYLVILVVYDGAKDRAYWLHVQQYCDEQRLAVDRPAAEQDRITIRIPTKNRLHRRAIETFRQLRNRLVR
jgi:hypothetical protein